MIKALHVRTLLVIAAAVLFCISAVNAVVVYQLLHHESEMDAQANRAAGLSRKLESAKYNVSQIQQFLTDASLTKEADSIKEAKTNLDRLVETLSAAKSDFPERADDLERIIQLSKQTFETGVEMTQAYWTLGKEAGDKIMKRHETGLDDLSDVLEKKLSAVVSEALAREDKLNQSLNSTIGHISTVVLSGLAILFLITSSALSFIWLRIKPVVTTTDSLGNLSNEVRTVSTQISSSASSLSSIVSQLSQAVEQTSSALVEMTAMTSRSSDHSSEMKASADGVIQLAADAKSVFQELIQSMQDIKDANDRSAHELRESNSKVSALVRVIEEVDSKTRIINDIVFQTKLLSFNASVEAARAGEHGKGFAVVAEEIGNLARVSGDAAQEINQLLDSSLQQVRASVEESKASIEKMVSVSSGLIDQGVEVMSRSGGSLDQIHAAAAKVLSMANEIKSGTDETSNGISEILKAVHRIEEAATVSSQTAENNSQTAGLIMKEADLLNGVASELSLTVTGKTWEESSAVV